MPDPSALRGIHAMLGKLFQDRIAEHLNRSHVLLDILGRDSGDRMEWGVDYGRNHATAAQALAEAERDERVFLLYSALVHRHERAAARRMRRLYR